MNKDCHYSWGEGEGKKSISWYYVAFESSPYVAFYVGTEWATRKEARVHISCSSSVFNCSSKFPTWGNVSMSQYGWVHSSACASLGLLFWVFSYCINVKPSQVNKVINILVVAVVAKWRSRAIFNQECPTVNTEKMLSTFPSMTFLLMWFESRKAVTPHSCLWSEWCLYACHTASDHSWDLKAAPQNRV